MKRLALLRHAKSSWDQPGVDDFHRPLNDRGRKAARLMGTELKRRGIAFDLCLASPAARVGETLDGVAETYGEFEFAVRLDPQMYLATSALLFGLIRGLPAGTQAPLIVGHNPGLEQLVAELTENDPAGFRERIVGKFPTGAFALIELPDERWADVAPGSGTILELILPREL